MQHPLRRSFQRAAVRFFAIALLISCAAWSVARPPSARAQDAAPAQAAEGLQSPAEFLGYELGDQFTPHHRVVDYVRHVAEQSPNVQLEPYGTTYEGRPLMVAYVSTPGNLSSLETIRQNNMRRTGLLDGEISGPSKAIAWLSYNVHGNESNSTEAAMATLHAFADPSNTQTQPWLQDVVVVIDPCMNPDGRDRYVHWYRETAGETPNPNPEAREHDEPWPGGRTNHYYFDLNRDWAWAIQKETQQRLDLYNRWMPHVHVDFHEQSVDAPYYFAPAARPFHENITEWQRDFQRTIGENNARYFDRNNWLYFTRQVFDLFYPGYGDTWPTFNGAIGMTYEQAGGGRAGKAIITAEGDTLTLNDRLTHHYTTSLSTVEAVAQNADQVLSEFDAYYQTAQEEPPGEYRTYVVKQGEHPGRLRALAQHLDKQGIRYGYASRERSASGFSYAGGSEEDFDVQPGDLIVSAYQPKSRLAKVLLEPRSDLADSLTYDITAWALPYAYGVDAYATDDRFEGDTQEAPAAASSSVSGRPYAYLAEWKNLNDARFLAGLLKNDVKARATRRAFTINGRSYAPGTLIITRAGNEAMGDAFDRTVRAWADSMDVALTGVSTGFVQDGPDFGSADVAYIERPQVAVLTGEQVFSNDAGEVWHYFDQRLKYPATLMSADNFDISTLREYDVLVMPSGSYSRMLSEETVSDLAGWVREGGRLIVMERAIGALADKEPFAVKQKETTEEDTSATAEATASNYGGQQREAISRFVPGSIHRVQLDGSHPLGFGFGEAYYTLKTTSSAYAPLENALNVGVLANGEPVSGFVGAEAQKRLDDTLVFGVQNMGQGEVVYLVDNPLFRGFWYGGTFLFANAVFLVGQG